MATTNKCKKCGCEDSFMPSPAPCPTPIGCPSPEPCSEVMDAQCIVYTGNNILCDQDVIVTTNDTVAEAIENIVDYFCEASNTSIQKFTTAVDFIGPTRVINHTLNTLDLSVSISTDGVPPLNALVPGTSNDYTYIINSTSQITIIAGSGWPGGNVRVTLIG